MKKPIIVLTLLLISATSYCQVQPPKKNYFFQFNEDELQVIWAGLMELQGKIADPVKAKITTQITQQNQPAKTKTEKQKTDTLPSIKKP